MPLYMCNSAQGAISESAKSKIASDVTRIHCDITGAPATFVHVFFFEEAAHLPLNGNAAFLAGTIRAGRTEVQKVQMAEEMAASIQSHTNITESKIDTLIRDTPASWVMEGGDLLPEPGEEAAWLAAHEAKLAETRAG